MTTSDTAVPATPVEAADSPHGMRFPLIRLLRPKQWIKNAFVLAPLVFAGLYLEAEAVARALGALVLFSMASSAAYIVNDLFDLERDRLHPLKRHTRPLAAGAVSPRTAMTLAAVLWAVLLASAVVLPWVVATILLYLGINVAYSMKLKHVPVVDLFAISAGFVFRVWAGALAIEVALSSWMLITTLCLALYLAAIKRRQELGSHGSEARAVLSSYSIQLLDRYAEVAAVGSIVFYALYIFEVRPELVITLPLVLFGLFRYWYIVDVLEAGESPTDAVWQDLPLGLTVVAWGLLCIFLLWPA